MKIKGRVQGVLYRASTQAEAAKLGLSGWVRNLPDGNVEVLAEGNKKDLEKLLQWCQNGPPAARVTDLRHDWQETTDCFTGFHIKY